MAGTVSTNPKPIAFHNTRARSTRLASTALGLLPGVSLAVVLSGAALWQTIGTFDPSGVRAVVFAPWLDRADAWARIGQANGRVAREGRWPFVIMAEPGDSDFSAHIRRLGAWFELNPRVAADCRAEAAPSP